ncbi:hypothetical protein H0A66_02500 [Alcaligenaceae bacterium]|nr:hypothetical protein [Alcaligenaceae bacterium]
MYLSRWVFPSVALVLNTKPLVGALAAALLTCSAAQAANFGHTRIVSALGQPLRIDVPVTQLSADDLRSISVSPAPAGAWSQAGLTPPVDLGSLQTRLVDGFTAGTKVIQVRSTQPFDKPVADLLLDVKTATGQQRFQVSLLTQAGAANLRQAAPAPAQQSAGTTVTAGSPAVAGLHASQGTLRVRSHDTMFAVARRHAVPGVTVYQMMIALQRANPQAFIEHNVNLVKAGSMLSMPDMAGLTAISDREARRIFQQQAQAFALYRQRAAGQAGTVVHQEGAAARGLVSSDSTPLASAPAVGPRDQLRLSGSQPAKGAAGGASKAPGVVGASGAAGAQGGALPDQQADNRVSTQKGIKDAEARVSQLEQNVKNLNQALQSQGEAATGLLVDGVKGLGSSLADAANAVTGGASSPSTEAPGTGAQGATSNGSASSGGTGTGMLASSNGLPGAPAANTQPAPAAGGAAASNAAPGAAAVAANNTPNNAAASDASRANGVAQPISTKAEKTVSWIQEHMLGVITGLLALIVLIIAWILRRANAARDGDDHGRLITEAMVQEKLDKINLDLEQALPNEPHSRKG